MTIFASSNMNSANRDEGNDLPVKNSFSVQTQKMTCTFIRLYAQKLCNSTIQFSVIK